MFNFLPKPIVGVIAGFLMVLNALVCCSTLLAVAIIKFILPFAPIRRVIDIVLIKIAETWMLLNTGWMKLTQKTKWDVQGLEQLNYHGWYLVNANHQSWVDILVLQHVFNRKIPMLKFFLKQELIKVPLIGLCWWALDFPFMKRYSKEYLEKHPEMRGKDLETTRKACEKFAQIPTSVMNFLEGTRFTQQKHDKQNSSYKHLLKPRAGGLAFALNAMGDKFQSLLNVTIVYPDGSPSFWDFLSGKVRRITVRVEALPIPQELIHGNYHEDPEFRQTTQAWVQNLWQEKDKLIDSIIYAQGQK
ncbi:acyltransferase [Bermanella sp. R86510]|uniref:acyltransferase n=1 Tax=unclassified Bermanella TaxID=2627862 RepID=UPI0037C5AE4C